MADKSGETGYSNWDMVKARASANPKIVTLGVVMLLIISIIGYTMMGGSSTAPDFEAQWVGGDDDGETFKLSDLQGKVVVLDLMATTCSPCKDIADDMLIPLHEKYKDDPGVVIISLSVGEDTPEGLMAYSEEHGYHWLHALDVNKEAFEAYNGIKIPKVVIIDPSGDLVYEKSSNRIPLQEVEDTVASAKSGLADTINLQSGSIWLMAVGAGFLSFFSPCSFPLLPGYVSFYLMRKKETSGGLNEQTMRAALPAGLAASAGILTIFLGLAIFGIFFSEAVREMVPVLIPITGAVILIMGLIMVADIDVSRFTYPVKEKFAAGARKLKPIFLPPVEKILSFITRKEIKFEENEDSEMMGQYLYGLGYGAASAGCTAPVFIALLVASMSYTLFNTALIFLLYAATTAALMVTFTLLVAASQDTIVNKMRASTGLIKKIGGAVLTIVGLYLVYQYVTVWA
tara:strand:+ start:2065 stop:3438 length:1374 start_codon:yes stop_codon:yes gene_type:complete